jgi:RNA polymerase sigma-70 factor (ECF subfamily)
MAGAVLTHTGIPESTAASDAHAIDLRAELARHHADCVGWAMACCGFDRTEAGDVLQTSYLKVLDGHAVFGGRSSFRTWLFGVVRRTAAEHRRRSIVRRIVSLGRDDEAVAAEEVHPAESIARREEHDRLRDALGRLPQRQRQVLHLVFQQELTVEAAASVMGVSVGSARTHYARGKARLRELLGELR